MNREIKFRAWNPEKKMFGYVTLSPRSVGVPSSDIFMRSSYGADYISFQHIEDWQQFTGLLDKNGVAEIYEGDIIDSEGIIKGNIYESPQIYEEGVDCVIEGMGTKAWRNTESIAMGLGCKYAQ